MRDDKLEVFGDDVLVVAPVRQRGFVGHWTYGRRVRAADLRAIRDAEVARVHAGAHDDDTLTRVAWLQTFETEEVWSTWRDTSVVLPDGTEMMAGIALVFGGDKRWPRFAVDLRVPARGARLMARVA